MVEFDYYYGQEAEQFSFFRVPRVIVKDKRFATLSSDAKLLYGLLLDRMSLSKSNGWLDEGNRVYIIYTIQEIREDLGCGKDKAIKTMAELDNIKGIGLVEKKRRGLGLPDILYIKNFIVKEHPNYDDSTEVGKADFKNSNKSTSRSLNNRLVEVGKSDLNYNNNNYNKMNQNLSIHRCFEKEKYNYDEDDEILEIIRNNIDYKNHMRYNDEKDTYEELYQVIEDVIRGHPKTIRIGESVFPYEVVLSRFMTAYGVCTSMRNELLGRDTQY